MDPSTRDKTAGQAHDAASEETFEEHFVRRGSSGRGVHLYHAHPPTGWVRIEGNLRPHRLDLNRLEPTDRRDPRGWPVAFLSNSELRLSVSRRNMPMLYYTRNADWDELIFVHRGMGLIQTEYGPIPYEPGDYIVLPCATTYRVVPDTSDNFFLLIESKGEFEPPLSGQPGRQAVYDPAGVFTPRPEPHLECEPDWEWEVRILADGRFSSVFYPWDPLDVIDWKGDLTAWKINLRDLRPDAQGTFVTPGAVLFTRLPQSSNQYGKPQKPPLFHRNTDCDELVFCHQRDAQAGTELWPGMASLNPRGLHHGPHAHVAANADYGEECAVLVEAREPLRILESGVLVEDPEERRPRLSED